MYICACWGYCLSLNDNVIRTFGFTIQMLVESLRKNHTDECRADIEDVENEKTFLKAIEKALFHFGTGFEFVFPFEGREVETYVYNYDSEMGGSEDDLEDGPYLEFNQSDLIIEKETDLMKQLGNIDMKPQFCTWVSIS